MFLRSLIAIFLLTPVAMAQSSPLAGLRNTADPVQEVLQGKHRKFLSREDIRATRTHMLKGQILFIDTRDQENCHRIQRSLSTTPGLVTGGTSADLCGQNPSQPIATVTILREATEDEWIRELNTSRWTENEKNMFTSTRNVALAGLGVAGALYLMPESISNWDRHKMRTDPIGSYKENVKAGPVWDHDSWKINFIGHPYSGAAYYQVARHNGLAPLTSFGYAVMMSTFYWEYGVEAFAETPSIQDLIFTPVIGSIMGEVFHQLELRIQAHQGKILGSQRVGSAVMILLNPMGEISEHLNRFFGSKVIQQARARWVARRISSSYSTPRRGEASSYLGVEIQFYF